MESKQRLWLAYHPANREEAIQLDMALSLSGKSLRHQECSEASPIGEFATILSELPDPGIFLLSDNFLRSEHCLVNLLPLLQKRAGSDQLRYLITPGRQIPGSLAANVLEVTQLDKISDLIHYINFWQEAFLDMRAQKMRLPEADSAQFNERFRAVRTITTEIGEILRQFREGNPKNFHDFLSEIAPREIPSEEMGMSMEAYFRALAEEAEREIAENSPSGKKPELTPKLPWEVEEKAHDVGSSTNFDALVEEVAGEEEDVRYHPELLADRHLEDVESLFEDEPDPETAEPGVIAAPPSVENILAKAETNFVARPLDETQTLATEVAQHPADASLRYVYAMALARKAGQLDEAIVQLEQVLQVDPDHTEALLALGELAELNEDFASAKSYYHQVLQSEPESAEAYYRLAMLIQARSGEPRKTAKLLKKAVRFAPANVDAAYQYALALEASRRHPAKAAAMFHHVLELDSQHPFANYDLALMSYQAREFVLARDFYRKAIGLNPELQTLENDTVFGLVVPDIPPSETLTATAVPEPELVNPLGPPVQEGSAFAKKEETQTDISTMRKPEQKTVLITGATSGIGKAAAEIFARNGYRIILTGRRADRLHDLSQAVMAAGSPDALTLNFDVRNLQEVKAAVENIPKEWRTIDVLLNNAGLAKGLSPVQEGDFEHWETMIDTNLKGLLYVTRLIAPLMVERKSGHIINICSTAGKEVYPNGNVYCATKSAVDALTKSMRLDLYRHNIRVSQVAPGHVEETEFALVRFDGDAEKAKIYQDFKPLAARDVAEIIYFIASQPPHVNIQDVLVMSTQQAGSNFVNRSGR
jgi:NADP-dependent 3-hydroxy acid dehydrogenase YdfG/cytochrome c-type biogenesis protein CcmH/NrfG